MTAPKSMTELQPSFAPGMCRKKKIEFLRWKAERWMKLRHMPVAFGHDPRFVARLSAFIDAGAYFSAALHDGLSIRARTQSKSV